MCSYAARGLWADLLGLMHEAEPYGHLLINGIAPNAKQIAGLLGGSEKEVKMLLSELRTAGVYSEADNGVIVSRRMIRDHEKRERDKANGKSGGNPALKGGVNPRPNPEVGDQDKAHWNIASPRDGVGCLGDGGGGSSWDDDAPFGRGEAA